MYLDWSSKIDESFSSNETTWGMDKSRGSVSSLTSKLSFGEIVAQIAKKLLIVLEEVWTLTPRRVASYNDQCLHSLLWGPCLNSFHTRSIVIVIQAFCWPSRICKNYQNFKRWACFWKGIIPNPPSSSNWDRTSQATREWDVCVPLGPKQNLCTSAPSHQSLPCWY